MIIIDWQFLTLQKPDKMASRKNSAQNIEIDNLPPPLPPLNISKQSVN